MTEIKLKDIKEDKDNNNKDNDNKTSHNKTSDNKTSDNKDIDNKDIDNKTSDNKTTDNNKDIDNKDIKTEKKSCQFLNTKKPIDQGSDLDLKDVYKKQSDKIDEETKDSSTFNKSCKLYFLSQKTGKLETRGQGKIMILKDSQNLTRILMIREKLMLKGCNHYITPNSNLVKAKMVKNSWVWVALDDKSDAEENYKKTSYFVTFKTEEDFLEFEKCYKEGQNLNAEVYKNKNK